MTRPFRHQIFYSINRTSLRISKKSETIYSKKKNFWFRTKRAYGPLNTVMRRTLDPVTFLPFWSACKSVCIEEKKSCSVLFRRDLYLVPAYLITTEKISQRERLNRVIRQANFSFSQQIEFFTLRLPSKTYNTVTEARVKVEDERKVALRCIRQLSVERT